MIVQIRCKIWPSADVRRYDIVYGVGREVVSSKAFLVCLLRRN
jgi:hypothetical protein